ncbi:hypothetical protein [Microbacterium sp. MPKO10]|uniref:hypothetical protein n=1 Tax=Microbacterium sp. MPKO10 TaxID=2989818 RepID=UPI002235B692|nr:hypothetical protein [Microbacterium sp. MPKO10]MCW4458205.1 hypothetical protein [Microbacterium sp. MPKO10]
MGRRKNKRKTLSKDKVAPDGGWPGKGTPVITPVSHGKNPVTLDIDQEEVLSRRLVWRFSDVDRDGEWDPAAVSPKQMADLLAKMANYESMKLREIFASGSQHGKKYVVDEMPPKVKKRLVDIERDDETELVRLRCGSKPRLYGFLREHIFHILWWDAEHKVYPSKKKHT